MGKKIFKRAEVVALRPAEWPTTSENYMAPEQAPYLSQILAKAKTEGYTKEQLASAWGLMLSDKVNFVHPVSDELSLAEALVVLFEPLSYYMTKRHYAAFLAAME